MYPGITWDTALLKGFPHFSFLWSTLNGLIYETVVDMLVLWLQHVFQASLAVLLWLQHVFQASLAVLLWLQLVFQASLTVCALVLWLQHVFQASLAVNVSRHLWQLRSSVNGVRQSDVVLTDLTADVKNGRSRAVTRTFVEFYWFSVHLSSLFNDFVSFLLAWFVRDASL